MDDDDFAKAQEVAVSRANRIVQAAIIFASEVPLPDSASMRPNSNTLVSKHVEAQLRLLEGGNDYELLRTRNAVEKLEHAHSEDGVRVKVTQPWHRDNDEHERKRN